MILATPNERRRLLDSLTSVAIVGASANTNRASYFVLRYLMLQAPFRVVPVNPTITAIGETECLPSLASYAERYGAPDAVLVFRKPSEALAVTQEAIAVGAKAMWYQYGVINEEAIALANARGLDVVVDRCMKVEFARFSGHLSIGGNNSGVISSKRRRPA